VSVGTVRCRSRGQPRLLGDSLASNEAAKRQKRSPGASTDFTIITDERVLTKACRQSLDILQAMYRSPKLDHKARLDAAKAALPFEYPRITGALTPESGLIIDADDDPLRARFERVGKRIDELAGLRRFIRSFDNPPPPALTEAEKLELAELEAWREAQPDYLKAPRGWYPDFCVGGQHREPAYDDPAERRQRLLAERKPVVEVKGSALLQDEPETAPEAVDDDFDADDAGRKGRDRW
jgi:hypothetical protein